jgi:mycothiol synthase
VKVRPLREADVAAVVPLMNEAVPEFAVDEAELRSWLAHPTGDVEFAVVERRGRLVSYIDLTAAANELDRARLDVRIPEDLLSPELLDTALDWAVATARARDRSLLRVPVPADAALARLLAERGYRPIRFFFHMRVDLDAPPPQPIWPEGIDVRSFSPGEEHAVYEAAEEAFEDHWEYVRDPFEIWEHFLLRADDFDPGLWFLALDGEEIAGVCLCRPQAPGRPGVGWVSVLGVRKPWRRRGLGLALLHHAFGEFWRRSTAAVGLGVDGKNTTGAVRLYEKAGMRVEHRLDTYERRLS